MKATTRLRSFTLALILLSARWQIQIPSACAGMSPYLQKGLTLRYEENKRWDPLGWKEKDTETIEVLESDPSNSVVKIKYEVSHTIFFPRATESWIDAINFGGDRALVRSQGSTQQRSWFLNSTIVIRDGITVSIEGDRADIIIGRAKRNETNYGGWAWVTRFALGYPTWIFVDPKTSRGDTVFTYKVVDAYSTAPGIEKDVISVEEVSIQSTPFGRRETIVGKLVIQVGQSTEYRNYSWDKETGIMVERVITGISQTSTITERFTLIQVHGLTGTVSERATTRTTLSSDYSAQYTVVITNTLATLAPYIAAIAIIATAVAIAIKRKRRN